MQDDLLDMTSTEAALGKPVGNDLTEKKITIPLILALGGGDRNFGPTWNVSMPATIRTRGADRGDHRGDRARTAGSRKTQGG